MSVVYKPPRNPEFQSDPVHHPKHYNDHPSGVECIEIAEHMNFNLGNAFKYAFRWKHKGGIEDLRKCLWYVSKEIDRRTSERWAVWLKDERYEVSTSGKIRRIDTGFIRSPAQLKNGYFTFVITTNGIPKCHYVHRVVAETFFGAIPKGKVVAHNDGDKSNNHLSNLRIDSVRGNLRDKRRHGTHNSGTANGGAKLTDDQVAEIRAATGTHREIAATYGVSRMAISRIRKGISHSNYRTPEQKAFERWAESEPVSDIKNATFLIWNASVKGGIEDLGHATRFLQREIEKGSK